MQSFLFPLWRSRKARGFTLVELLVVIAILALLAAILFPVFARARENARRTSCQSNLKQIGIGFHQYLQDSDGRYPQGQDLNTTPTDFKANRTSANYTSFIQSNPTNDQEPVLWPAKIEPYVKSRQIYMCPSTKLRIYTPGDTVCDPCGVATWDGNDPAFPDAAYVTYGYNFFYLGGGVLQVDPCTGTRCRDAANQNANRPGSGTECYNCGLGALETTLTSPAETVLLNDNAPSFRANSGTGGQPSGFASVIQTSIDSAGGLQTSASGGLDSGDSFDPRHLEGLNVLFCDGHVKWMTKASLLYRPSPMSDISTDPKFLWNRF